MHAEASAPQRSEDGDALIATASTRGHGARGLREKSGVMDGAEALNARLRRDIAGATAIKSPRGATYEVGTNVAPPARTNCRRSGRPATAELYGPVRDVPAYHLFRDKRNATSHAYDPAKAAEVIAIIDTFIAEMRHLHSALEERNVGPRH